MLFIMMSSCKTIEMLRLLIMIIVRTLMMNYLTLIEGPSDLGAGTDHDWVATHQLGNNFENQMVESAWAQSFPLLASRSGFAGSSHSPLSAPSKTSSYSLIIIATITSMHMGAHVPALYVRIVCVCVYTHVCSNIHMSICICIHAYTCYMHMWEKKNLCTKKLVVVMQVNFLQ